MRPKDYDKAIEIRPAYAEAYLDRGGAYQQKGNLPEAIRDYEKAFDVAPPNPPYRKRVEKVPSALQKKQGLRPPRRSLTVRYILAMI
ncbi:MAG: tetratricopeptide repeat protein [Planctomycetes bacterium]|nr:tetratricopeptide repeat protein [Planctomycetota bacterium]